MNTNPPFPKLSALVASVFLLLALAPKDAPKVWTSASQPLQELAQVRKLIKAPTFKNKDYPVTAYGAQGDGTTLNTEAFKKAVEACHAGGGGRVVVPAGTFLTGPIYLKSNVNLHVREEATIVFSQNPKDYPLVLVRWHASSFFAERWQTIVSALSYLLEKYPEFDREPHGKARIQAKIEPSCASGSRRSSS